MTLHKSFVLTSPDPVLYLSRTSVGFYPRDTREDAEEQTSSFFLYFLPAVVQIQFYSPGKTEKQKMRRKSVLFHTPSLETTAHSIQRALGTPITYHHFLCGVVLPAVLLFHANLE